METRLLSIEQLKKGGHLIFECISGSRAYGLDTPTSDTDIKGIYLLPEAMYFGLDYVPQVSNDTQDLMYFELGRFVELLAANNPTALEVLNTSEDKVLYRHPLMDKLETRLFLTKKCKDSFAGYANSQVKKAKGLNKKIHNPMEKERKSILHFCYVTVEGKTLPLIKWLETNGLTQEQCGLVNLANMKDLYALYTDTDGAYGFKGIMQKETANAVSLSSIPKGLEPATYLYFNKDGYTKYCKDHKAYWDWVKDRNEARYQSTLEHGKNYDAKNMMHTFRLLNMAEEILRDGQVNVKRADREFLLAVKSGTFSYQELVEMAQEKLQHIEQLAATSPLPDEVDLLHIKQVVYQIRKAWYTQ
ncbi:nucleotidyltransferase domain-containing protein [Limibacter armeniacum]|uniref:nucleotidyltransferase domain-containing protein n=1 Tax=Limibacter armeniacum TaxID=466084 RepID=UPI002FE590F1